MDFEIRRFAEPDAAAVRRLFVTVNRLLAPPALKEAFEAYVERSLTEEMGRISDYYRERDGAFWVAERDGDIIGMFGLEAEPPNALELRRMYVASELRRSGVASAMLQFAEDEGCRRGATKIILSTSELQPPALALYRGAGFRLVREAVVDEASNKTIGGGIKRFYFEKSLPG